MDYSKWKSVDDYLSGMLVPDDPFLTETLQTNALAGLPAYDVSPLQGRLLYLLAKAIEAKSILEIGTLGGYSTIWLARALSSGGRLITLERNPDYAEIARRNLDRAGFSGPVEIRLGPAAQSLAQLVSEGNGPFDLIFIDADKANNPEYLGWSLKLSHAGTVIIGDNVVRNGDVADPTTPDPCVQGVRRFIDLLATNPRLSSTVIQTVGCKGYDGFAIALVGPESLNII